MKMQQALQERFLARVRETARTPDLRTTDELLEAAAALERYGDDSDRALALEARRAALLTDETRIARAAAYLHRVRAKQLLRLAHLMLAIAVAIAAGAALGLALSLP